MNEPIKERFTQRRRVFHVDDNQDTLDLMAYVLSDSGFVYKTARTYDAAQSQISRNLSDIYLIDNRLPDGAGIDLIREIREQDKNTPILFFSADGHEETKRWAVEAGAQQCVAKPADPYVVLNAIRQEIANVRVRNLQARLDEREAVLEMLTQRTAAAGQQLERARSSVHSLREIRSRARSAFLSSGGTRVDFVRFWDSSISRMPEFRFNVGDVVERMDSSSRGQREAGQIIAIIPDDRGTDPLTLYDIEFAHGRVTLHGFQIQLGPANRKSRST